MSPGARATLPGLYVLVPVKDPARGKSRLAPLLDAREREALNLALARRTLACCAAVFGAQHTIVVSAARSIEQEAWAQGVRFAREAYGKPDLNAALALAARSAQALRAQALLVVPTDLVLLDAHALRAAADALPRAPGCLLVPDRRREGTNLLGLAPARADFFAFGGHSLQRHAEAAAGLGMEVRLHADSALALDLDLPEDYALWQAAAAAGGSGHEPAELLNPAS